MYSVSDLNSVFIFIISKLLISFISWQWNKINNSTSNTIHFANVTNPYLSFSEHDSSSSSCGNSIFLGLLFGVNQFRGDVKILSLKGIIGLSLFGSVSFSSSDE